MKVSASILSCDFSNMYNEFKKLENSKIDFVHLDIMDGHFVPNISFGPDIVSSLKKISKFPFEAHLMISHPLSFLSKFESVETIIFHLECNDNPIEVVSAIKNMNKKVGISIKPKTSVQKVVPFLDNVDLVLIMTVEPGFGGQKFMNDQIEKIEFLKNFSKKNNLNFDIEVDGGINDDTCKLCSNAGASICVAGTYIFKSDDVIKSVDSLKEYNG